MLGRVMYSIQLFSSLELGSRHILWGLDIIYIFFYLGMLKDTEVSFDLQVEGGIEDHVCQRV